MIRVRLKGYPGRGSVIVLVMDLEIKKERKKLGMYGQPKIKCGALIKGISQ